MKKQLLTLAICLSTISSFAADLYVNGSGLPGTYATLQAAIDAASDGDNIYVSATETHNGPVTVDKSVYIISDQPGSKFQLVGDVIVGNNIDQVTIVGANGISVSSQNNAGSRVHVNLISSSVSALSITHNNYKVNIYDCFVGGTATFRNGIIIGSELSNISIQNETGVAVDTIKIIANEFEYLSSANQIHNIEIKNNFVNKLDTDYEHGLFFSSLPSSSTNYAIIANNTIEYYMPQNLCCETYNYSGIYFNTSPSSFSGLTIVNNYIKNNYTSSHSYAATGSYESGYAIYIGSSFPNVYIANNKWYYGYQTNICYYTSNHYLADNTYSSCSYSGSNGNLSSNSSNLGLDQAPFYDIDGTRNDLGNSGGPHAWSQYHTSGGKAVIFDLEIPSQIYLGTSQSIKAKGVHKN